MTTSIEHNNAPAVPQGDTVEIIGMKGGKDHYLGTMAMPPRMKAREIAREQFGHFVDDDGSDAELCFCALEQLIDYMQKTVAIPAPAPAVPDTHISVQEAWEAAGGNPGIKASKADLIIALKTLDTVCDEADPRLLCRKGGSWCRLSRPGPCGPQ